MRSSSVSHPISMPPNMGAGKVVSFIPLSTTVGGDGGFEPANTVAIAAKKKKTMRFTSLSFIFFYLHE
jgi:hypothetical protein